MTAVLAGMPDLVDRTLAEHVPDRAGRCVVCRQEGGASAEFPCLARVLAEDAKAMNDTGRVGGRHAV
jgi:hypothetical protein